MLNFRFSLDSQLSISLWQEKQQKVLQVQVTVLIEVEDVDQRLDLCQGYFFIRSGSKELCYVERIGKLLPLFDRVWRYELLKDGLWSECVTDVSYALPLELDSGFTVANSF